MTGQRVIIAGGRNFKDKALLYTKCEQALRGRTVEYVLCGMAPGADKLGHNFAIDHGYKVKEMPADWNRYGKAAGPIRNGEMARDAGSTGILIAFWDGKSRGTRDMIFQALDAGLEVFIIRFNPAPKGVIVRRASHECSGVSDSGAHAHEQPDNAAAAGGN